MRGSGGADWWTEDYVGKMMCFGSERKNALPGRDVERGFSHPA